MNNQAEETIFLKQKGVIFKDSKLLYFENYLLQLKLLLFDKFTQYLFNLKLDSLTICTHQRNSNNNYNNGRNNHGTLA